MNPYAVGDINSDQMGSAARANGDKPNWSLMPLRQVADIMDAREDIQRIYKVLTESPEPEARIIHILGSFQENEISAGGLLKHCVAYNLFTLANAPAADLYGICESLVPVIKVWEFGLKKYAEFNWAKGANWSVPIACIKRHIDYVFDNGELYDTESSELHSAHVVCNAMMLVHYQQYWPAGDDRPYRYFRVTEPANAGNPIHEVKVGY